MRQNHRCLFWPASLIPKPAANSHCKNSSCRQEGRISSSTVWLANLCLLKPLLIIQIPLDITIVIYLLDVKTTCISFYLICCISIGDYLRNLLLETFDRRNYFWKRVLFLYLFEKEQVAIIEQKVKWFKSDHVYECLCVCYLLKMFQFENWKIIGYLILIIFLFI